MIGENELKLAGMNVPEFLDRLMQNESLVALFVRKFLADGNYAALMAAYDAGDWKAAEVAAHTLKGMCGNLSLTELFALFSEVVRCLRAGDTEGAIALRAAAEEKYGVAAEHLGRYLGEVE